MYQCSGNERKCCTQKARTHTCRHLCFMRLKEKSSLTFDGYSDLAQSLGKRMSPKLVKGSRNNATKSQIQHFANSRLHGNGPIWFIIY